MATTANDRFSQSHRDQISGSTDRGLVGRTSAADVVDGTRREAALVGGEPGDERGKFVRLTQPAHRDEEMRRSSTSG